VGIWRLNEKAQPMYIWRRSVYGTEILYIESLEDAQRASEILRVCEECGLRQGCLEGKTKCVEVVSHGVGKGD